MQIQKNTAFQFVSHVFGWFSVGRKTGGVCSKNLLYDMIPSRWTWLPMESSNPNFLIRLLFQLLHKINRPNENNEVRSRAPNPLIQKSATLFGNMPRTPHPRPRPARSIGSRQTDKGEKPEVGKTIREKNRVTGTPGQDRYDLFHKCYDLCLRNFLSFQIK